MMVQLTHVNRVYINDPFPDLRSSPGGSQRAIMCAYKALLEPWKVPKCHIYGPNCIVLVVTTQMGQFGPNQVTLGYLMTFLGAKRPDSGLIGASKGRYLRI